MTTLASLQEATTAFRVEYAKTPKKLKVLDSFAATSLLTAAAQLVYAILFGTFPFNAFLAGFFCTLGAFVLTVALRAQVEATPASEKRDRRKFGEYAFAMILLLFASWNYIG